MANYISKIREKIGQEKFIHPAARILVENDKGEFLFVEKRGRNRLGVPAGGLEENETIEECIKREVKEETGLDILDLEVIGISSSPRNETVSYPNGDEIQYFTIEFYSNSWTGTIKIHDVDEISVAGFRNKSYFQKLPKNEQSIVESYEYFRKEKRIRLK